ncbi:unnamed protein product [Gadus morhua 'NCC']
MKCGENQGQRGKVYKGLCGLVSDELRRDLSEGAGTPPVQGRPEGAIVRIPLMQRGQQREQAEGTQQLRPAVRLPKSLQAQNEWRLFTKFTRQATPGHVQSKSRARCYPGRLRLVEGEQIRPVCQIRPMTFMPLRSLAGCEKLPGHRPVWQRIHLARCPLARRVDNSWSQS